MVTLHRSGSQQGQLWCPYLLCPGQPPTQCPQCWGGETLSWFIHVFQPLGLCVTWYWFIFTCLWTCVHTYIYSCMQIWYMYVHTYVEAGENFKCHPQEHHPSFLKLILSLTSSVRSGLQLASPQNPPVSIPQYWGYKTVTSGLVLLHAFWGSHTALVLTGQVLYWLACHSCSLLLILNPKIAGLCSSPVNVWLLSILYPL